MGLRRTLVLAMLAVACEGRTVGVTPACADGHTRIGRTCVPKFEACPSEAIPLPGGGCQQIGVLSKMCLPGFAADGDLGCKPVLPPGPCVPGYMSIPGDALCRAVVRCPTTTGKWDSIPTTGTVLYVDATYAGGGSDGTTAKPFVSVQGALDAMPVDGDVTIAIAPGVYFENLALRDLTRTVQLWGRCPAEVVLRGASPIRDVVELAGPSELHQLTVAGGAAGVSVAPGGRSVQLDGVWIHEANDIGLLISPGKGSIHVRGSLIAQNKRNLEITSGDVVVERTAILSANPEPGELAPGIEITGADLTLELSLIEGSVGPGIHALASDIMVRASVIRRNDLGGRLEAIGVMAEGGTLQVLDSFVDANRDAGIQVAAFELTDPSKRHSKVRVERSVVRGVPDVGPGPLSDRGVGIALDGAEATILDSLIVGARYAGVSASNSAVAMERTIVRGTVPSSEGSGFGVWLSHRLASSQLTMSRCALVGNAYGGLVVDASTATVSESVVRGTVLDRLTKSHGAAILVRAFDDMSTGIAASAVVTRSLLADNAGPAAELFGGSLRISSSVLSCNGGTFTMQPLVFQPTVEVTTSGCGCGALAGCP